MAITLTEKLVVDIGNTQHKIFQIAGACETVTISMGGLNMNFVKCSQFIPLSFACSGGSTAGPIMVAYESSAGGTDITLSAELTVDLGLLKVWGY